MDEREVCTIDEVIMWKDIVKTAIIGTKRQPLIIPRVNNATGTLLTPLDSKWQRTESLVVAANAQPNSTVCVV